MGGFVLLVLWLVSVAERRSLCRLRMMVCGAVWREGTRTETSSYMALRLPEVKEKAGSQVIECFLF